MVETRSQKASEDKKGMSEVEIHPNPVLIEYGRDVETKEMGIEGFTSESITVEQGHDFATSTGTLDPEEMLELSDISTDDPAEAGSLTKP